MAYFNRGKVYCSKGDYKKAIDDYDKAIHVNPEDAMAYNSLSWLLATCSEAKYRNGNEAIGLAKRALELKAESDKYLLDTLAAAYAEAGNFEEAVSTQEKAIRLLNEKGSPREKKSLPEFTERLNSYKAHKPWREGKATGNK